MSRGSSIHFEKTKETSAKETTRTFKVEQNYLLPKEFRKENEFWVINNFSHETADKQVFDSLLENAKGKGKRPIFENSIYEAVVNLESNHSLEDLQELAEYIKKEFGFTCTRIAIHKDEGHIRKNENGKEYPVYNYHAHLNFVTIDEQGKQCWQPRGMHPKKWIEKLSKLQDQTAKILKMKRGTSGGQRLDFREYRKAKQAQEQAKKELDTSKVTKNFLGIIPVVNEQELKKQLQETEKKAYIQAKKYVKNHLDSLNEKQLKQAQKTQNELQKIKQERDEQEKKHKEKIEALKEMQEQAMSSIENAEKVKQEYSNKIKNAEISNLLMENESLSNELKTKELAINKLESEANNQARLHRDLQNNAMIIQKERNSLEEKCKNLEEKCKNLEEEISYLKSLFNKAKNFINYLFSDVTDQTKRAIKKVMGENERFPNDDEFKKIKELKDSTPFETRVNRHDNAYFQSNDNTTKQKAARMKR